MKIYKQKGKRKYKKKNATSAGWKRDMYWMRPKAQSMYTAQVKIWIHNEIGKKKKS